KKVGGAFSTSAISVSVKYLVFGWNLLIPYVASRDSPAPCVTLPCSPDNALVSRSSLNATVPSSSSIPRTVPTRVVLNEDGSSYFGTHTLSPFVTASKMGWILDVIQIHHLL
ncbi:hypothetical protein GYMLUDRAFT_37732, partial [Collybiopsis luxurians FD-317 M1]